MSHRTYKPGQVFTLCVCRDCSTQDYIDRAIWACIKCGSTDLQVCSSLDPIAPRLSKRERRLKAARIASGYRVPLVKRVEAASLF